MQVCQGSGLVFPPPPKPQGKTPELQKHLEQLQARLEQQHYDAMVADVTQAECAAAALREGGLQTYKQQLSFGAHILLMMAAFYAFGHLAGMAFTRNKLWVSRGRWAGSLDREAWQFGRAGDSGGWLGLRAGSTCS